jgi:transglutaminase-like putative cysteine protease
MRIPLRERARRLLQLTLAAVPCAIAGLSYRPFFATWGFAPAVLCAAVGGTALVGLAARRRWGPVRTAATAGVGFVLLMTYTGFSTTLHHHLPTLATVRGLSTSVLSGWSRMLSVSVPADPTGELLVTPVLLTLVAALCTAALAVRSGTQLAPAVPPIVAYVVALLFTAAAGGPGVGSAVTLLAALSVLVLARVAEPPAPGFGVRTTTHLSANPLLIGLPVAAAAVAFASTAMTVLPAPAGSQRFDPRTIAGAPIVLADQLTPLALLKGQLREESARVLFRVRLTGQSPGLVRTAALDQFDGALWSSRDTFLLAGRTLPRDPELAGGGQVAMHVTLVDFAGPYLPVAGWPVRIDLSRVGVEANSGVLVTDAPTPRGTAYTMVGSVRPDDGGLRRARLDKSAGSGRYTGLPPGLPAPVQAKARQLTTRYTDPYSRLAALTQYLRTLPYSLTARPGHSYEAIEALLDPSVDGQLGYAEQHASALAVMARSLGIPARVAVGYRLAPQRLRAGSYEVTSHDAHAWVEVPFAGYGWVPFDPTNPAATGRKRSPEDTATTGTGATPGAVQPTPEATSAAAPAAGPKAITHHLRGAVLLTLAIAAVLAGAPTAVVLVKRRRRRRRHKGGHADQIVGAWQEAVDRLCCYGVTAPSGDTASEVGARAARHLGPGAAAAVSLAPLATTAVFGPGDPGPALAEHAWRLESELGRSLRATRGPARAAVALVNPVPLALNARAWLASRVKPQGRDS